MIWPEDCNLFSLLLHLLLFCQQPSVPDLQPAAQPERYKPSISRYYLLPTTPSDFHCSSIPWPTIMRNVSYCTERDRTKCLGYHCITSDGSLSTHFCQLKWKGVNRKSWKFDDLKSIQKHTFILPHIHKAENNSNYSKWIRTILQCDATP